MSHDLPPAREDLVDLALTVNGRPVRRRVPTTMRLLHFLRDELGLTGAKEVCAEGECGACAVLLDGQAVASCLILAVEAQGAAIVTAEGIEHPVKAALAETHAVQCGYCFPGLVVSAAAFLDAHPAPTREAIKEALAGNLCRCTGYAKILEAVERAARCAAPAAAAKGRDA